MSITSYSFILIFLPILIIGYYFLNRKSLYSLGKVLLLVASLGFYYSLGYKGLIALSLSIVLCYILATFAFTENVSKKLQKFFLAIGIILCVLVLLYCKYLTYFEILLYKYTGTALTYVAIVVPIGISYFTFSQIAYLVDSYRDNSIKYSLLDYALFISFFPKITVGPIALSTEMIPQFNDLARKKADFSVITRGFYRFTLGLSKKLLLADNLAPFVDLCYQNIENLGTINALLAIIGYTLQLYFDFSGYCDISIGICQMLGLDLCENFDSPYKALSIAEFWKRWHMSLTRFFTRYVYIPLGGNRKGKVRTYVNTLIIFLISGLWHGAATTFVVWGLVHGIGMIISKIIAPFTQKLPKWLRWFMTFSFVSFAWVLFRSPDLNTAMDMFKQVFSGITEINDTIVSACLPVEGQFIAFLAKKYASKTLSYYIRCSIIVVLTMLSLLISSLGENSFELVKAFKPSRKTLIIIVTLFVLSILSLSQVSEFIYVNF